MAKYVDNKKFYLEISKYVTEYNERYEDKEELPRLSEYLGECFLKIATNLSLKFNFASYKFREEMISDGYFDCIKYAHKFNSEKTKNAFSYFTQICWNAFIRKIQKEKKVLYTKFKAIDNSELFGLLHTHSDAEDRTIIDDIGYSEGARENMQNFIRDYEAKHK